MTWLVSVGVLVGLHTPAFALKPSVHAELTEAACVAANLSKAFCRRIATENYNTDAREWDDLRAHAQIDDGETACDAADRTAHRLWQLGTELNAELAALKDFPTEDEVGRAAALVGRALHTIQDNCAHGGMPNPQHAWHSLTDFCEGTETSPDVQADAITCARTETRAVMTVVATAIRQAGVGGTLGWACPTDQTHEGTNQRTVCDERFLPAPWDACEFLGEAEAWDGIDRRWDNADVVPVLRAELAAGLARAAPRGAICTTPNSLATQSEPAVDVTAGAPSCKRVHLMCFGSADNGDNPFADDEPTDDTGGCAVGAGGARGLAVLLLVLVLVLAPRRRSVS